MQALTGERLLTACDQGEGQEPLARALTLLAAAMPECSEDELMQMPIRNRNRLLLNAYRLSFGSSLDGYAECPQCGMAMEVHVPTLPLLLSYEPYTDVLEWSGAGKHWKIRQVTTADLYAVSFMKDSQEAEQKLLMRCLGIDPSLDAKLSHAALKQARKKFGELHTCCELRCTLRCHACEHPSTWEIEPADFVWAKARHAARQLLADIHTLALYYGWSEAAVVGMSSRRREAYMELLNA